MAVGLNSIREICVRCPLAMNETLLRDLVQYKKYKDKGVMIAAKGLASVKSIIHRSVLLCGCARGSWRGWHRCSIWMPGAAHRHPLSLDGASGGVLFTYLLLSPLIFFPLPPHTLFFLPTQSYF